MVLYLKLDQKIWGAGDYTDVNANALTGTIYSNDVLSSAFDLTGWTLKIKVFHQPFPDAYILSDPAEIVIAASGTWRYKPTLNKMEPSGLYQVIIQLTKGNERLTAIGINGSAEILIKKIPTIT